MNRPLNTRLAIVSTSFILMLLIGLPPAPAEVSAQAGQPTEILPYQAPDYRYRVISSDTTPPTGFEQPGFDDSGWSTGAAPFGSGPQGAGCFLQNTVNTLWPTDTDLLVRKVVSIPAGASNMRILFAIDNDLISAYVNGVQVSGHITHGFCPNLDEFTIEVPSSVIQPGANVVAFRIRDLGVESFFDTRILAEQTANGWRMAGYNPQRTNAAPFAGPSTLPDFQPINPNVSGSLRRIADDGSLIVATSDTVYSYTNAGALQWSNPVGGISDVAIGPTGVVYVSTAVSVTAFNGATGLPVWPSPVVTNSGNESSPLAIDSTGTIYFNTGASFAGVPHKLTAIRPDGTIKWEYFPGLRGYVNVVLSTDELSVYVLGLAIDFFGVVSNLVRLSADTGAVVNNATFIPRGDVYAFAPWNTLYTGEINANLLACSPDLQSLSVVPTPQLVGGIAALAPPGLIAVNNSGGTISVINTQGEPLWTSIEPLTSVIADGNNMLYALAPQANDLVALSFTDGSELWRQHFNDPISAFFLSGDGNLYVTAGTNLIKTSSAVSCTLTCTANITVPSTAGQCGALVDYPAPTLTGICGEIICSKDSGAFFPVGTTTVTCSNSTGSSCSFAVTVQDAQPPSVTCPGNINVSENPSGSGSAVVNYSAPVTDNCAGVTATCAPPSGSTFELGTTTVTCSAVDATGNTSSCTFTVTVTGPSLFGKIAIWDGEDFWPLDGGAVRSINVTATRVSDGFTQTVNATNIKPHYRFDGSKTLPQGTYNLSIELDYVEVVTVDNDRDCGPNKGCLGRPLRKTVKRTITGVQVPSLGQDIKFPLPLVMVHGILSCYQKWHSPGSSNEAQRYWDNFATAAGFISLTPNYHYVVRDNLWLLPAAEVETHIQRTFRTLTSRVSQTSDYPRWVYIGHSQGGLIARVLINSSPGSLINKLQKVFLLGTPNSGARDLLTEICFEYLGESEMQTDFNIRYPTFGSKDVTVYAGTRECNFSIRSACSNDCSLITKDNDTFVSVESVHRIYQKICSECPPVLRQVLRGDDVFYNHCQLGSPDSLEILSNRILPQVLVLTGH